MPPQQSNASWVLNTERSTIQLESDGGRYDIPALSIWESQFENIDPTGFHVNIPGVDLPNIRFSRFPLNVSLKISGSSLDELCISFVSVYDNAQFALKIINSDQTVHNTIWYLLDEVLLECNELLAEKGIVVPGRVNIGQLIWLRANKDIAIPVIDTAFIELRDDSIFNFESGDAFAFPYLNTSLFPYQKSGIRFLAHIANEALGCILADEMGLGKTLQAIGLLVIEKSLKRGPNLIICPATLLENWRRELIRFAPELSIMIHAGIDRTAYTSFLEEFDVIVTSYDLAVRDVVLLTSLNWNVLALDEAQNIKNPDAQRTKAVKEINRRTSVAITGTPVENRLTDLWSISDFVLPGLLGDRKSFEDSFEDNPEDASLLAPLVAPIILRRRVLEVAKDLPPRLDIDQPLVLTEKLAVEYERVRQEIWEKYGNSGSFVSIGKLRQLCAHPRLLGINDEMPNDENPKYRRLLEVLEEIFEAGEKALIFTSYLNMSDLITNDLVSRFNNIWVASIDGRLDVKARQPLIDAFSSHRGPAVFVLNPIAAGTGLNITAANHVVHYNPEWNPAVQDQAAARAYRRTQTRPVTVHHFFYVNTVEEVMMERLNAKRLIAHEAVTGHAGDADSIIIAKAMQISPLKTI